MSRSQSGAVVSALLLMTAATGVAAAARPATDPYAVWRKAHPRAEAEIAALKRKTAALVGRDPAAGTPRVWSVKGGIQTVIDCRDCPEMVVAPAGQFAMGPKTGQQWVRIAQPFAVSRYAVTFDDWNACLADGGCGGYRPSDHGWGRGRRPVMEVNFADIANYLAWLSRKSGHSYRLLSEAEYEYATRAGATTLFPFGDDISPKLANYNGSLQPFQVSPDARRQTLPVGSFPPNRFGLYDMVGNVWTWTADCWTDPYGGPLTGAVSASGDCTKRAIRGGAWDNPAVDLESDHRHGYAVETRNYRVGFRVARSL